jgi:hypothetical protein
MLRSRNSEGVPDSVGFYRNELIFCLQSAREYADQPIYLHFALIMNTTIVLNDSLKTGMSYIQQMERGVGYGLAGHSALPELPEEVLVKYAKPTSSWTAFIPVLKCLANTGLSLSRFLKGQHQVPASMEAALVAMESVFIFSKDFKLLELEERGNRAGIRGMGDIGLR